MRKSFKRAENIFKNNNGILRYSQATRKGIHPPILRDMVEAGILVKEGRGLYRLADLPPLSNPDLVQVAMRVPQCVICLISALSFHDLTTQIPYKVYVAIPQGTKKPRLDYPPIDVVKLSEDTFNAGIGEHNLDGVKVRIYNEEKTIVDCFKFRNKIGTDVAIEALKNYLRKRDSQVEKLLHYAKINRVDRILKPYLEATI